MEHSNALHNKLWALLELLFSFDGFFLAMYPFKGIETFQGGIETKLRGGRGLRSGSVLVNVR
jgi:hypothetical protein